MGGGRQRLPVIFQTEPMQTGDRKSDLRRLARLLPRRRVKVALDGLEAFDLAVVDDWLQNTFEIAAAAHFRSGAVNFVDATPMCRMRLEFARRVLLLWGQLLRAARVPVFDPGVVLGVSSGNESTWSARLAIAHVDEIDQACYLGALRAAVELVHWCSSRARSAENAERLQARLDARVLPGLRRSVPGGQSTIPVLRQAHELGIPFLHLSGGIYQLGWGRCAVRLDRSMTDRDTALGAKLALNKLWSAALLRMAGFPAPEHVAIRSVQQARAAAESLGWPVVVKPADTDRGEGVTVGIACESALTAAVERALARSPNGNAIVERQVPGVCHRLFIARGRLLYAVKRLPISAVGDGRSSVGALIDAANARERCRPSWLRKDLLPNDARAIEAMAAAGFTLESVPAQGQLVPLRDIESTEWGGVDEDVTHRMHPDNVSMALGAAKLFGLDSAGIDVITSDIGRSWCETGAIVNEVNFAPLLGEGEVSRLHVPEFLGRLLEGGGRIPIEAFVGESACLRAAARRQGELNAEGRRCYVTSRDETRAPSGIPIHLPFDGLASRCRALLLNGDVGALILVISDDEVLETGLPVDRIDRLTCVPDARVVRRSDGQCLSADELAVLLGALAGDDDPEPEALGPE